MNPFLRSSGTVVFRGITLAEVNHKTTEVWGYSGGFRAATTYLELTADQKFS
jgi:hypothetical protein